MLIPAVDDVQKRLACIHTKSHQAEIIKNKKIAFRHCAEKRRGFFCTDDAITHPLKIVASCVVGRVAFPDGRDGKGTRKIRLPASCLAGNDQGVLPVQPFSLGKLFDQRCVEQSLGIIDFLID